MKTLIAFLLALFSLPSLAAPSCLPGFYGPQWPDAKNESWARGQHGWFAYGWCKGEDGAPVRFYLICTHGLDCPSWDRIGLKMRDLGFEAQGSTKRAVYGAWWDQFAAPGGVNYCEPSTLTADTPKKRACDELMSLMERDKPSYTPPAPPPTYTHAVAPLTGSVDRPSRRVNAAGQLETYSNPVRVPIGTDCDLSKLPTFTSGQDVWAAVVNQPYNLRWLCRKK